jgi:penicillin-binding protein 2
MEPRTGAILALYSSPPYDPNAFVGGIRADLWRALNEDPARPLLNRAISTRYPPASTFKLAIATMALRRGLVRFDSHMPQPCRGGMQLGNRFFRCWKAEGHGSLTLEQAIASSCDVYFYQLGLRLGVTHVVEDGIQFGFHERTDVDLPGEIVPSYPTSTEYYDRLYGRGRWSDVSGIAMNLAIGQGENAQTLINMVRFYAALSNGGHFVTPHVVEPRGAPRPPVELPDSTIAGIRLELPDSTFAGIRRALIAVVERGTAHAVRLDRIQMAGKTGTAQNPHGLDHGWFIGFAPADNPAIVVGGIMEFAEHGTTVAPYVARVIERYLLGPDSGRTGRLGTVPLVIPEDTAPRSLPLDSHPPGPTPAPGPGRLPPPRPRAR